MNRSTLTGAVVALLLGAALVAVLRGGSDEAQGPAALVPGDARAYLQLSSLPEAGSEAEALVQRLGFGMFTGGTRRGISAQLGFDPFDADALLERGLDPMRPVAGFLPGESKELVVLLPAKNAARLETTLKELWADRVDGTVESVELEGQTLQQAMNRRGEIGGAWARIGDQVVVTTGAAAPQQLLRVLAPGGAPRLTQQPTFLSAWESLGPDSDLFVWALPEAAAQADRRLKAVGEGLDAGAFSLTLGEGSVEVGLFGDLGAVAATALPLFVEADPKAVKGLLDRLYPEAVLAARFSLSFTEAWKRVVQLPSAKAAEALESQLRARGIELSEVLPLFDGNVVGGLSPLAQVELSRMPALDLRRTNPFVYFRAEVRAGLKDAAGVKALLPQAAEALAPALRADVVRSEMDGIEAFTIRYHLGEGMTFGVIGSDLVATGGEGAFAAAVSRQASSSPGYGASIEKEPFAPLITREGSVAAALQVDRLLTALGAVTSERLGGGPGGMAAAMAFRKLRATLEKLDHLSLTLVPGKSEVVTRVALELVPAPAAADPKAP